MRNIIIAVFAMLLACGCEGNMDNKGSSDSMLSINVRIEEKDADTRSSTMVEPSAIEDINIFVYDDEGLLVTYQYSAFSSHSVSLKVYQGRKYSIYAVANVGDLTNFPQVQTVAGLEEMGWSFTDTHYMTNTESTFPLSGKVSTVVKGENVQINIPLRRLVAKFRVILDTTNLKKEVSRFHIKRIRLRNLNSRVSYFLTSKAGTAEDIMTKDIVYEDAQILPAFSEGLDFYLPENAQGDLLSGNTGQETHIPGASHKDLCTYIEFLVDYRSNISYNDSLIYRYYLHDGVQMDNFDVLRNTMYTCVTSFTGYGLGENTWRIDVSGMKDYVRNINVDPARLNFIFNNAKLEVTTTVLPVYAENRKLKWHSTDESVVKVYSSSDSYKAAVISVGNGECYVVASTTDGSGVTDTVKVQVAVEAKTSACGSDPISDFLL